MALPFTGNVKKAHGKTHDVISILVLIFLHVCQDAQQLLVAPVADPELVYGAGDVVGISHHAMMHAFLYETGRQIAPLVLSTEAVQALELIIQGQGHMGKIIFRRYMDAAG